MKAYNLNKPSEKPVRLWGNHWWGHYNRRLQRPYDIALEAIRQHAKLFEQPEEDDWHDRGNPWYRPHEYLAAALASTCNSRSELKQKLREIFDGYSTDEVVDENWVLVASKTFTCFQ